MKRIKFFIYSAGGILLAAALERFLVAGGHVPALSLPEPVLGIPLRYAALLTGGFELVVALVCLFGRQPSLQLGWLAWLATNYWVYRIGLFTMHCHQQGTCIGSLTDPLHLSGGIVGVVVGFVPVCLLAGSYTALFLGWLANRRAKAAQYQKTSCPACGVHIRFDERNVGRKIPCPHCKAVMTLRKSDENLKMACYFCKEHIQFPPHALGTKMPCPHCRMDITLKESA